MVGCIEPGMGTTFGTTGLYHYQSLLVMYLLVYIECVCCLVFGIFWSVCFGVGESLTPLTLTLTHTLTHTHSHSLTLSHTLTHSHTDAVEKNDLTIF